MVRPIALAVVTLTTSSTLPAAASKARAEPVKYGRLTAPNTHFGSNIQSEATLTHRPRNHATRSVGFSLPITLLQASTNQRSQPSLRKISNPPIPAVQISKANH
jgi:hypothetical protein